MSDEYKVIEKDGKKIRVLPEKYNIIANSIFLEPLMRRKGGEDLKYSFKVAKNIKSMCNFKRPTIIFSNRKILSAMSTQILNDNYNRQTNYKVMDGSDIISAYLGDSILITPEDFTYCDVLFVDLNITNELAQRQLYYLADQVSTRWQIGKNTIVYFKGTKQGYVAKGGSLKCFENVVDTVANVYTKGYEETDGKTFNDITEDRSVKRREPHI